MAESKTQGQIEAAVTAALTQFERDFLGRGPREARTFIVQDLVLVRLKGVLSAAEQQLSREPDGVELIKKVRSRLVEGAADQIARLVEAEVGIGVVSMHTDISTRTGERFFVFELERPIDEDL
jgi:uncharacterized protein YbcI